MRQMVELSPGWLREEIDSALQQVAEKPYITEQLRASFQSAAVTIKSSDRLRRADQGGEKSS
jgi:hypothetical protein